MNFLTAVLKSAKMNQVSEYVSIAQRDTPAAGGVQTATEQNEALSHLLSVRRKAAARYRPDYQINMPP